MKSHTISCAGEQCEEYSLRVAVNVSAAEHRRDLGREGWTDIEGRDYCPEHSDWSRT